MKKKSTAKIVAFLALFWIILWIVWTWVLVIFSWNNWSVNNNSEKKQLTQKDLQKIINNGKINTNEKWLENTNTWTKQNN